MTVPSLKEANLAFAATSEASRKGRGVRGVRKVLALYVVFPSSRPCPPLSFATLTCHGLRLLDGVVIVHTGVAKAVARSEGAVLESEHPAEGELRKNHLASARINANEGKEIGEVVGSLPIRVNGLVVPAVVTRTEVNLRREGCASVRVGNGSREFERKGLSIIEILAREEEEDGQGSANHSDGDGNDKSGIHGDLLLTLDIGWGEKLNASQGGGAAYATGVNGPKDMAVNSSQFVVLDAGNWVKFSKQQILYTTDVK